jgi:hypothetical protein
MRSARPKVLHAVAGRVEEAFEHLHDTPDETTAPVLDPGRGRTKKGQLWAYARDQRPWGPAGRRLCLPARPRPHRNQHTHRARRHDHDTAFSTQHGLQRRDVGTGRHPDWSFSCHASIEHGTGLRRVNGGQLVVGGEWHKLDYNIWDHGLIELEAGRAVGRDQAATGV